LRLSPHKRGEAGRTWESCSRGQGRKVKRLLEKSIKMCFCSIFATWFVIYSEKKRPDMC
jgi:hypothetical protein